MGCIADRPEGVVRMGYVEDQYYLKSLFDVIFPYILIILLVEYRFSALFNLGRDFCLSQNVVMPSGERRTRETGRYPMGERVAHRKIFRPAIIPVQKRANSTRGDFTFYLHEHRYDSRPTKTN